MCAKPTDSSSVNLDMLRQEFEKFRAGLGDSAEKLGDNAHDALNQISDYLKSDNVSDRLASVGDHLNGLGARLKDSSKDAAERIEAEISDKPFISLALAFGVGLLAASLMRRG